MRFDSDENIRVVLRDLAEAFLYTGQYERGLTIFAALVRNDPTDIWVYNALATVCAGACPGACGRLCKGARCGA